MEKGTEAHNPNKKRKLTAARRLDFEKKLSNDFAYNVHCDEISKIKRPLTMEPKDVPNLGALRKVKDRMKNDTYIHKCPLTAVKIMKHLPKYNNCIKEFAVDPINIIFWTKYQQFLYSQIHKSGFPVQISIDSTGGIISKNTSASGLKLPGKPKFVSFFDIEVSVCIYIIRRYSSFSSYIFICHHGSK